MGGETTKKCEGVADVKRELVGMVVVWGREAVAATGPVQGGVWEAGRVEILTSSCGSYATPGKRPPLSRPQLPDLQQGVIIIVCRTSQSC